MYPFLRAVRAQLSARRDPPADLFATHVGTHLCWPWDLDLWLELNNGRALTLYDLGRIALAERTGLTRAMRREGWGLAVAGASVRYRQRVRMFDRLEMRTRLLGWDDRFLYIEQSLWRGDACTSHLLVRGALTDAAGIVAPGRAAAALGIPAESPPLPGWVSAWIAAEAHRPWPPMAARDRLQAAA